MPETNRIKFEKARDYKRINLSNVITEITPQGDVTIEFYEDIEELPAEIIFYDDKAPMIRPHKHSHTRHFHFGATLPVQRLPEIIDRLQGKLNEYIDYHRRLNDNDQ